MGLDARKPVFGGVENNKGADQPVHTRRLISAFVIRFLESLISKHASSEISMFWLLSEAGETGLSLTFTETLKTGFVALRPIYMLLEAILTRTRLKRNISCHFSL